MCFWLKRCERMSGMFLDVAQAFGPNVQTRTKNNKPLNPNRNIFICQCCAVTDMYFSNMCHMHQVKDIQCTFCPCIVCACLDMTCMLSTTSWLFPCSGASHQWLPGSSSAHKASYSRQKSCCLELHAFSAELNPSCLFFVFLVQTCLTYCKIINKTKRAV